MASINMKHQSQWGNTLDSLRVTLLKLVSKMKQPSIPELLDLVDDMSYYHEEYRKVLGREYGSIYYYLTSLTDAKKTMSLEADEGYRRRYCIYSDEREFERYVNPIPLIKFQKGHKIGLILYGNEIMLDMHIQEKEIVSKSVEGKDLQILRIRNRIFIILDHVLIGVIQYQKRSWQIRLPWRIFGLGTEYMLVLNTLKRMGEEIDVLGVKGKRTVCG